MNKERWKAEERYWRLFISMPGIRKKSWGGGGGVDRSKGGVIGPAQG